MTISFIRPGGLGGTNEVVEGTTAPAVNDSVLWVHPSKTVNSNENIPTLHEVKAGAWVEILWKVGGNWQDAAPSTPAAPGVWTRTETEGLATTGTWAPESDTRYSGGSARYSNTAGSTMDFTFTGTGVRAICARGEFGGIVRVYIDGVDQGTVDLYTTPAVFQAVIFESTTLTNAQHTIRLEVTGTKNASSGNTYVTTDAFEVFA